jgi:YVTN family beta-propeller protein
LPPRWVVGLLAVALVAPACGSLTAPARVSPAGTVPVAPNVSSCIDLPYAWAGYGLGAQAALPTGVIPPSTLLPQVPANTTDVQIYRLPIPSITGKTASIDILEIDQATHRLYVADRTDNGIDLFDVSTACPKYLKTIDMGSGPNGVVVAKTVNKVFAGLNDSSVAIIDIALGSPSADKVVAKVSTGGKKRADELDYDPKDRKIYIANSDDGIVTVIDATTNAIIKKFENMGDALEQPRYDPADGMMYLTSSGQNAIFKFDPSNDVIVKKFDIGTKCDPNGIAINPTTNQAVLGCSSRSANAIVLWDLAVGRVLATFDETGAADAVFYSAKADRFFVAASNFNRGAVMSIFTGNPVTFRTNVPTAVGSHGVAYDETNNLIYTQDQNPNEGAIFTFPPPR